MLSSISQHSEAALSVIGLMFRNYAYKTNSVSLCASLTALPFSNQVLPLDGASYTQIFPLNWQTAWYTFLYAYWFEHGGTAVFGTMYRHRLQITAAYWNIRLDWSVILDSNEFLFDHKGFGLKLVHSVDILVIHKSTRVSFEMSTFSHLDEKKDNNKNPTCRLCKHFKSEDA